MSAKTIPDATFVDLHVTQGLTVNQVAQRLGVSFATVTSRLRRAGVEPRLFQPRAIDLAILQAEYVEKRRPAKSIAAELGVDITTVLRCLREAGITPRDASEVSRATAAGRTPERRRAMTARAHEARRGPMPEAMVLEYTARQAGRFKSDNERRFHESLLALGVQAEPNYQVGRYIVDLAIPSRRFGIEVDGGNWHTAPRKRDQDGRKEAHLVAQGWMIVRLRAVEIDRLPEIVARHQLASGDPAAPRQEWVPARGDDTGDAD